MSRLRELAIKDLRPRLQVVAAKTRIRRPGPPTSGTLHYNGPALPFYPNAARELAFVVGVDTPYQIKNIPADSLQYHYVVLSDGQIWQTRDLDLIAAHCGNATGNVYSLAVHLTLGERQAPTPQQWLSFCVLAEALSAEYNFPREAWYGHNEWPRKRGAVSPSEMYRLLTDQSACPGPILHKLLAAFRRPVVVPTRKPTETRWWLKWRAPVRQAPQVTAPVAGYIEANAIIAVDLVKSDGDAQEWKGDRRWLHLADGRGFIWVGNAEEVA